MLLMSNTVEMIYKFNMFSDDVYIDLEDVYNDKYLLRKRETKVIVRDFKNLINLFNFLKFVLNYEKRS